MLVILVFIIYDLGNISEMNSSWVLLIAEYFGAGVGTFVYIMFKERFTKNKKNLYEIK